MGITVPGPLYVTDNFNWHRNGEVQLSVGGVLDNPTNVVAPGAPANALQDLNNRSQIQLDDGSSTRSPALVPPPYMEADNTLRRGGSVASVAGVMSYSFNAYEIHPTGPISFTRENDRVGPPDVGGSIQVGAYNVLNYFTTIDNSGSICGPDGNQGCRGADTASEFTRQRDKIVDAIVAIDADVLGLMEIENHPGDVPVADLVAGLNAAAGAGTYDYIATGAVGEDAIRQAIIYQPAAVSPVGGFALLDESVDSRFLDEKNRPVIAQTFEENATGERLTVAVNHLKSKGSPCDDVGDPDAGDGQGRCNGVRTAAAEAMVDWLAGDPTGSGDPDFLITGDLNAYAMEDPIAVLTDAGYVDMVAEQAADDYSFVFFGQSGYLDHALASPSLAAKTLGTGFWHTNADEPRGLDYNQENNQPFLYNPDEWRASDHDPVVAGLAMEQTPIYDIQGDGDASPYEGEVVTTTGVVTGDFQGDEALRGFYAQDVDGDGDPATSDGIFVFDRFSSDVDVSVGDLVEITGEVDEFFGETQTDGRHGDDHRHRLSACRRRSSCR